jgi:TP901 family phage tail tape measure protein
MATLTSKLIVQLIDRATGPARAISSSLNSLTAASARNAARLSAISTKLIGTGAAAFALGKSLSSPIKVGAEFESLLEDVRQKGSLAVPELKALGLSLRGIASATNQLPLDTVKSFSELLGLGLGGSDSENISAALKMLPAINRVATAYRASSDDVARAGQAAFMNLKVPAAAVGDAFDAMASAGKAGAFELKDMAKEFPSLTASAQALKMSGVDGVAKLAAALQIARKGAADGSEAATNTSNLMQKIISQETTKKFKKLGIDIRGELKKVQKDGGDIFEWISGAVNRATKGDLSKIGDLFEDAQVQKFLRPLLQNLDEYKKIRDAALKSSGETEKDFAERIKTAEAGMVRFKAAVQNLNIALGSGLLPTFGRLLDGAIVPFVRQAGKFAETNPRLVSGIASVSAGLIGLRLAGLLASFSLRWMWGGALAAATGSLRILAGTIALVTSATKLLRLAMIGTGIGAALLAIGAAGMFIKNNWKGIGVFIDSFGESLKRNLGPNSTANVDWLLNKLKELHGMFDSVTGKIDDSVWKRWGEGAGQAVAFVIAKLGEGDWSGLGATIGSKIWAGIKSQIGSLFGNIKLPSFGSVVRGMANGPGGASSSAVDPNRPSVPISKRALGGPVRSGGTYLVGERGPELFRANASGHVTNTLDTVRAIKANALAGAGGGSMSVNVGGIHIQASGGQSPEAIASAVERRLSE